MRLIACFVVLFGALLARDLPAADLADPIGAAIADPARSDTDRERDARDRPADVLGFAGLMPGMAVADVFGGGGYYSELVSRVVGPKGRVVLVNNIQYDNYAKADLQPRLAGGRLPNVTHSTIDPADLKLGEGAYDLVLIVMSYHDIHQADPPDWPAIDAGGFLDQIARALKPGGVFLIVDHAAKDGTGTETTAALHRIDEAFAKKDIGSHGLVFEASFDLLRNPDDPRTASVFDPSIRGKTDRFVHRYRKPKP